MLTLTPRRLRQLWYVPLLALAMGLMMLRLLLMARVLDVRAFSEFAAGSLVSSTFCMLGCLGLQPMLQREWPVNMVRRQEMRGLVRAAQCNVIALLCCLAGLLGASLGLSLAGMTPAVLSVGLLHGLAHQLFLVATVESRSRGEARRFAGQNLVRAAGALSLSVVAAVCTGSGVVALAIDSLLTIALALGFFQSALRRVGAALIYSLAIRRLNRVRWKSALTLMGVMIVGFSMLNVDRWVASDRLSARGFAYYSFAWIVLSISQSVQTVINASLYPLVARRFAQYGRGVALDLCLRTSLVSLVVFALAAVPMGYLLDYGVQRWYPEYAEALVVLPLFLAIAVLRISDFWSTFLHIAGFEARLLKLNLGAAALAILVWISLAHPFAGEPATLRQLAWLAALLTSFAYVALAVASRRTTNP